MQTEAISRCPKCQAQVPPEAPQGLCPKCLLTSASLATEGGPSETNPPPTLEAVATAFPQLEILQFVGQGGMGFLYKARQAKLDRVVALKLLPQKPGADPAFAERFNREARVLARLSHPNIVAVHDFGQVPAFFYLLMEYVDGVNLRQAMRAGRFTPPQAMALVPKICDALQYAHEEGVLHRDIKPENLLLDTRGRVKIADFGIAKLLGESKDITLTASGATIGTPHYMAPEQLERPHEVDQRADIYSLGVVFYEMLTGELPLGRFVPPSEKATMDPRVDEVVMRTLEKERERRYQSAGEVRTSVEYITANPAQGTGGAAGTGAGKIPPGPLPHSSLWSWKAMFAAALVGVSLAGMLPYFSLIGDSVSAAGGTLLCLFVVGAALLGAILGSVSLLEFRAASPQLRGARLAQLALLTGAIVLMNALLLICLAALSHNVDWPARRFISLGGVLGLLVLNAVTITRLVKRGPKGRTQLADNWLAQYVQLPRPAVWVAGLAVLALFVFLTTLRHTHRRDWQAQPPPVAQFPEPNAPAGYEIPPGAMPPREGERTFRTSLSVPAGYVLSATAVLRSNQVVLPMSGTRDTAFVIAPSGSVTPVQGQLTWRLQGNTALADGAPLEFSLSTNPDRGGGRKMFHVVPAEPLTVDWVSEPPRLWPPPNGRTKYLILRAWPTGSSQENGQTAEWTVGIELRLDPIPAELFPEIKHVVVGLGTNWMEAFESGSTTKPESQQEPLSNPR